MSKFKNRYITNLNPGDIERLQDEYKQIGFHTHVEGSTLVVHSTIKPTKKQQREKRGEVSKSERKYGYQRKETDDAQED